MGLNLLYTQFYNSLNVLLNIVSGQYLNIQESEFLVHKTKFNTVAIEQMIKLTYLTDSIQYSDLLFS